MTAISQVFYKQFFVTKNKLFLVLSLLFFASIPLLTYLSLKHISLDMVYLSTSLTIVMVTVLSITFLKEKINLAQILGILMIIIGLVIYSL
jgi:uncharacterized membrane protein